MIPTSSNVPTEGSDTISGSSFEDIIDALGGDDIVFGSTGGDWLYGGLGNDQLYADTYDGSQIKGTGDLSDTWNSLMGNGGDDTLTGGTGLDDLWGGTGNDQLLGGKGKDYFVFEPSSGQDYIADFKPGEDYIWVMPNMNGTGDPMATQNVDGLVLDFGNGNSVLLAGIHEADLPNDAIQFWGV
jgi:Ca2+-binding RTX toxin-like protein